MRSPSVDVEAPSASSIARAHARIAEHLLAPERPHRAAALRLHARTRGCLLDERWETYVSEGLLPASWIGDEERALGRTARPGGLPTNVDLLPALAAALPAVLTAEALAREGAARVLGAAAPTRVRWGARYALGVMAPRASVLDNVLYEARDALLQMAPLARWQRGAGDLVGAVHAALGVPPEGWSVAMDATCEAIYRWVAAREIGTWSREANPYEPFMALWHLGFAFCDLRADEIELSVYIQPEERT